MDQDAVTSTQANFLVRWVMKQKAFDSLSSALARFETPGQSLKLFVAKLLLLALFLILFNAGAWICAGIMSAQYPFLIGLCGIAYSFGLRHAVDADHIAAIDNTVRKLVAEGKRPLTVGMFFSLGHSTIVIILSIFVACGTYVLAMSDDEDPTTAQTVGGYIGTCVSAGFLLLLGIVNGFILFKIGKSWAQILKAQRNIVALRTGAPVPLSPSLSAELITPESPGTSPASPPAHSYLNLASASSSSSTASTHPLKQCSEIEKAEAEYAQLVKEAAFGGWFENCCPRILRLVDEPWKCYPIGLLFGLGFDTATEVGILAMSATTALSGMPPSDIMVLPFLFTAGMCMIDSCDGVVMLWAYGWATLDPLQKILYNFFITLGSVCVAIILGCIETLQVIQQAGNYSGDFWDGVADMNMENVGFIVVGIFVSMFLLSLVIYYFQKSNISTPTNTEMDIMKKAEQTTP